MKTTRITTRKKNTLLTPLVNSITTRLKKGNSPKNNSTRSTRTILLSLVEDDSKKNEAEVEASRDA